MDGLTKHSDRLPDCDCHECAIHERNRLRAELAECRRDALAKIGPYYVPSTDLSDDEVNAMYAMIDTARKGEGGLMVTRLKQIAHAIADANYSELSMRIPAEPDRDADLVVMAAANEIERLRAEIAECREDAERYRTALEQIVAPFEDLNFVSGNKLLNYIHDTATAALAAEGGVMSDLVSRLKEAGKRIDAEACFTAADEITRLRAELAEAPVWRPISTAPIEGRILLWRAHGTVPIVARFDPIYGEFENEFGDHVYNVTHWMPLPAAPNEIDAARKGEGE